MKNEEKLIKLINENLGLILSSQVDKEKISREYLSILVEKGVIERLARGVYLTKDAFDDEIFRLQARFKKGIYSHGTALFLHDLSDRTPLNYTMTFPNKYHAPALKEENVRVFYVNKKYHNLGIEKSFSPLNREIETYSIERTIVDIIRSRNSIDSDMINTALNQYVKRKDKNINLLIQYAKVFRIEKIIRLKIEVLL